MIVGSIARRYARALFELAVEQGKVEPWSRALLSLEQAVGSSEELRDVLENPVFTREQRRGIVEELVSRLQLDAEPANLLYLLAVRDRLSQLGPIAGVFGRLADAKLGRVRASVVTAISIEPAAAQSIGEKLARATRAEVILERTVDPELLGGAVAQVGSLTYDGSLRTQLEDLRKALKR